MRAASIGYAGDKISNYANFLYGDTGSLDPIDQFGIAAIVRNVYEEESAHWDLLSVGENSISRIPAKSVEVCPT